MYRASVNRAFNEIRRDVAEFAEWDEKLLDLMRKWGGPASYDMPGTLDYHSLYRSGKSVEEVGRMVMAEFVAEEDRRDAARREAARLRAAE